MTQVVDSLLTKQDTKTESLAPGFGLRQSWLLQTFGNVLADERCASQKFQKANTFFFCMSDL